MNSGAVQLVEYFHRIDFLATFVLLTLSFVHLLAPPRVRRKRKRVQVPQPAPVERSLFLVYKVVGEDKLAGVKLREDRDAGAKLRSFRCLPIEPIASASQVLQVRFARDISSSVTRHNCPIRAADRKRGERYPMPGGTTIIASRRGVGEAFAPMEICDRSARRRSVREIQRLCGTRIHRGICSSG